MEDPFNNTEKKPATRRTLKAKETITAVTEATTDGKIVTTFKLASGFDAPWIVVHSDTVEEARNVTSSADFKSHVEYTFKVWAYLRELGKELGMDAAPANPNIPRVPARPAKANPPGVPNEECAHGVRNYVSKGNWAALFCSAPQGTSDDDKCEPLWRQKDGTYAAK